MTVITVDLCFLHPFYCIFRVLLNLISPLLLVFSSYVFYFLLLSWCTFTCSVQIIYVEPPHEPSELVPDERLSTVVALPTLWGFKSFFCF